MSGRDMDFDVTKNIKIIETLKCELLSGVSDLFKSLSDGKNSADDRDSILSGVVISAYMLSNRLGADPNSLNKKIAGNLRIGVLDGDEGLRGDYSILLKYFTNCINNASSHINID